MPTTQPTPIPFPLSSFPGANPQESAGRLINCTAEPLGEAAHPSGPSDQVWRRQPGLSQFNLTPTGQTGYRGGLTVGSLAYEAWANNASRLDASGAYTSLGAFPGTKNISIARNQATTPDVVAVDIDNGAYILATAALASATISVAFGGTFTGGDVISLTLGNAGLAGLPQTLRYTVVGGDTAASVATTFFTNINANTALSAVGITATNPSAGVLVISHAGALGNATTLSTLITGAVTESISLAPASGQLTGGAGTLGIVFTGTPLPYNGLGVIPQPNSICFLDGYFFFTIGNGRVFASNINSLVINGLTFIDVVSKADVSLLRAVAFSGILWLFTTGNCEIWQNTAQPFPGFPFSKLVQIEYGLIQPNAIAGWETGFSELLWVAQDFSVYWCGPGSTAPIGVSPPDLNRLIEAEVRQGHQLEAGVYIFAGKKFWVLSSPNWTWEFNLGTRKWNERVSLAGGVYGRWRARGGHLAFSKWVVGDAQSGNLLFVDDQNYTENGTPQLFRLESGPVRNFPNQIRIARADFDFDMGVGQVVGTLQMIVTGAAAAPNGNVRLTVHTTSGATSLDTVSVSGVTGTTEANGTWQINVVDVTHIELIGVKFVHGYTGGGIVQDLTVPTSAVSPVCAISVSKDGGTRWGNPLIRQIGRQAHVQRMRASVKSMGLSGPQGTRWRIDVTDPVYTGFLGATQSSDPRTVGA